MNGDAPQPMTPTQDDPARLELAMAAAAAERANKPRGLVILGVLALLIAGVYAFSGLMARASTIGTVEAERRTTRNVIDAVRKVQALQEKQSVRGLAPDPRIGKELEDLAQEHGVKADATGKRLVIPESEVTGVAVPGIAQKKYVARFSGQDPGTVITWLAEVLTSPRTTGVELSMITLRPDAGQNAAGGWTMDIEFVRWESRK